MFPIVILAGGLATRLRPITEKIPKSLIEINEQPFVIHQLKLLEEKGFTEIHFCLGYLGEQVEEVVRGSEYYKRINIRFSYDGEILLGTGGTLRKIINQLPDYFFITYGDSYLDIDFGELELIFMSKKEKYIALMNVFKNDNKFDANNVVYENGEIKLYSKTKKDVRMSYIDYGVGIISKSCLYKYEEKRPFDLGEIYEEISINGELLGAEVYQRFYEIGSFQGIKDLSNYLKLKK